MASEPLSDELTRRLAEAGADAVLRLAPALLWQANADGTTVSSLHAHADQHG